MTGRVIYGPTVGLKTCDGCGGTTSARPTPHPTDEGLSVILCRKCRKEINKTPAPR
jgi:hypothetical protein